MLTPKPGLTLLLSAVMLALLAAGGCGSKDDSSAPPPQQQPGPQKVRVEFRPPESGERLRRHIYAPDGVTEVELQIEYADGRMEFRYFRADGSLKESRETHPGGRVVKRHALYAADGTTVVAEEKYRLDGSLETEFKLLPDGTKETVAYRSDGKRRWSHEVQRPDSSSVKTYYRKDGATRWAVFTTSASAQRQVDYYGNTGVLEHTRLYRADGMDVAVYRADGTVSHRQSWRLRYGGWYYRSYVLERVTEYAPDGTTPVRELKMSYDGATVTEAHLFNPDGSKASIRYFRGDGTLEKEEFLDKDGKVKKTETHKADEGIRESVDQGRLKEPAFDDPSDPYRRRDD